MSQYHMSQFPLTANQIGLYPHVGLEDTQLHHMS